MATKAPTTIEEQDEAYNRVQNLYDRELNWVKENEQGPDSEEIEGHDRSSDGFDGIADNLDDVEENGNGIINDNADNPKENIDKVEEKESNPDQNPQDTSTSQPSQKGGGGFFGKLAGKARNIGPGFTIASTLLASMGVISTMMSPGILLVQMKEIFHNDGADATRSSNIFSRAMTAFKLGKSDCSKPGIKCKMSTMSKEQVEKYRNAGFKIEGDGIDKDGKDTGEKAQNDADPNRNPNDVNKSARYKVTAVVFPNGDRIESKDRNMGQKFHDLIRRNIHMRIASLKAFNPKSALYQSKSFNKILSNFKLAKGKVIKGSTDEERKKQFNQHSGGQSEADNKDPAKQEAEKKKTGDKITADADKANNDGKSGFSSAAVGVVAVACGTYNFSRIAVASVKAIQIAKLIGFGFMFLQAADQIKNNGSIEPETVAMLATMLTYYESNKTMEKDDDTIGVRKGDKNPKYNLSATDSQGYRIAGQKDKSGLKSFAQNYMVGGKGPVANVSNTLSDIENFFGQGDERTGKQRIRTICKNVNSLPVLIGSLVAACLSGVVGDGVGVVVTIGLCVLAQGAKGYAYSEIIRRWVMPPVLSAAIAFMDRMNIGSDLKGVDAGNAMAVGAGLMLGITATEYGLRPAADTAETQEYVAYTDQFEKDYIEVAKYEARDTPFDYTNKYSFLGSIVTSLNLQENASTPVFAGIANVLNILPRSFAMVGGGSASALYNQPSAAQSERFNCPDKDLINTTIKNADKFCQIRGLTPTKELEKLEDQAQDKNNYINEVIDWMQAKQTAYETDGPDGGKVSGGTTDGSSECNDDCKEASQLASIDDNGKPIEKSQYAKYIKYCSKRTLVDSGGTPDYWGTSTMAVEDGSDKDQLWYTGEQCMKDTKMMQMFRAYTGLCNDSAQKDNASACYEDDSSPVVQSGNVCDILNNPNIIFVNEGTKEGLKEICEKGHSTNSCGKEFTINQMLIDTMVTLSSKYKIWVNNFGFEKDRYSCDSGQHPLGNAIDLNGIEKIGGGRAGGDSWGGINFSASQVPVVKEYAEDWLKTLPSNRGGVGQKGCGGFDIDPAPGATSVNGYMFFEDSCDHLHIDIRNRDDVNRA